MRYAYLIASAFLVLAFSMVAFTSQSQAAQLPVMEGPVSATEKLLDKVQFRRCRRVRFRCRNRFGGGRRYRRCVRRRDCRPFVRRVRRCVRVRRICRNEFGFGRDYRRCVRRRDCRL